MTTITRERLLKIQQWSETYGAGSNVMLPVEEAEELARIALASLEAEPVAYNQVQRDMMKDIIVRKMGGNLAGEKLVMDDIHAVTMALIDAGFRTAQPASEREQIRREHAEWSDATFGDVGPIGPLKHLSKEALEAAAEPDDLSEWADMQFLLWDAQRRAGITDEQITQAMVEKLAVNKQREWPEPKDGEPRLHIKDMPAPVMPAELHPDTQNLVADFCTALAEKLYKAQLKYGYDADWKQDGWHTQCLAHFHQHIAKGDPRDVAAYCAFMWYHGWKTESVSGPVVPEEMPKGLAGQIVSLLAHNIGDKLLAQKIWNACRAVMLQSKYRDLSQPVDPQISEYEKIMLRAGWVMVPVEPTDEMIAAAMNCEDVLFNSDESFCVQFGNIYEAMLAAAPQPEISDGK
ncbi:hypothetical protein DPQ12_28560 [Salmonella enterica subsp. enterica serovar Newport]|nr:hypothetical protein [Salmonella enterica subsp. enterica serovar Newport]EBS4409139.1 hypothetical protein [Salmonella enterica subsp. enterica serovar Newport]